MTVTVSEFQTLGTALLDRVKRLREEVSITDSGIEVARLVPPTLLSGDKPWHELRGSVSILADLTQPIMSDEEVEDGLTRDKKLRASGMVEILELPG